MSALSLSAVPRAAAILGFAGVLPFLWGLAISLPGPAQRVHGALFGAEPTPGFVILTYGTIILAFMSGVLWGFATRADPKAAPRLFALSTLPALWVFFLAGRAPDTKALVLIAGFLAVLALDVLFWRARLTPPWWMGLRVPLTTLVCAALGGFVLV